MLFLYSHVLCFLAMVAVTGETEETSSRAEPIVDTVPVNVFYRPTSSCVPRCARSIRRPSRYRWWVWLVP